MIHRRNLRVRGLIGGLVVAALATAALGQGRPGNRPGRGPAGDAPPVNGVAVLDLGSLCRLYHVLKPPLVDVGGKLQAVAYQQHWLNTASAPPAADWMKPDFDDTTWALRPARTACQTPYLEAFCLRGKFMVTDPAKVKGLNLALACNGGAIVYLNGQEVARDHVTPGKGPVDYADAPGGGLGNVPLPVAALRAGVNVLALEVLRAPYRDAKGEVTKRETLYTLPPNACQVSRLQLVAPSGEGLVPNVSRPTGLQIWNGDILGSDFTVDYGNPCEKLQPVTINAVRNGAFSGKVVVGSSQAIRGLSVTPGDLRGAGGAGGMIPAAAVQIRYGIPWGSEHGSAGRAGGALLGAVVETAPAEVPAGPDGAVVPIWITVKPSKTAAVGTYTGEVKVTAGGGGGRDAVSVPVRVNVGELVLPDPQNFRTVIELIESPDTLSLEYKVPLWSDPHFALIAESFRQMSPTGSRFVHIPVIAHTNLGNAESMVRWIKTGEKQYDFDFSVMDKYLNTASKNLGTPKVVVLQVWELYMSTKDSVGKRFGTDLETRHEVTGGGRPQVTFLDKATGKTELGTVLDLMDPASKAIWAKLLAGVREHLQARGLDKALMFGMFTDAWPPKEHVQFFHALAPDVPWVQEGHGRLKDKIYGLADVGYQASVWGCQFADGMIQQYGSDTPIPVTSRHGWNLGRMDLIFERNTDLDEYPLTRWHFYPETAISGETRGLGRIGADYWKVLKDKQGRRKGWADDRFPEGSWGGSGIQLNLCSSVLAPGPQGPVATTRLLSFCEGLQESEARIILEQALLDAGRKGKLGGDLAQRCQILLDDRLDGIWKSLSNLQLVGSRWGDCRLWRWTPAIAGNAWAASANWPERNEQLFRLAGEVQKRVGP